MTRATISDNKKRRGRPATGVGTLIGLRWHEPDLTAIDEWRRKEPDMLSHADAIRRLVKLGLSAAKSARRPGGPDPVVPVRLPKAVVADIDRWAKREKIERSKAVRALIEKGLADALDE